MVTEFGTHDSLQVQQKCDNATLIIFISTTTTTTTKMSDSTVDG